MALDPMHEGRQDNRTGRSDLGDTEDMLRRLLNLEGLVPMDWGGIITPIAIVGDCTLPGYGRQRLRRWNVTVGSFAAGGDQWVKATQDVIIDRVTMICAAAATIQVAYQGSGEADPGAINLPNAPMIDRSVNSAERAPVLVANIAGAFGATIYTSAALGIPAGFFEVMKVPLLLAAGCKLRFSSGANVQWNIEGRTF